MNKIREAEYLVLDAVEVWRKKILKDDTVLNKEEQEIFNAAVKLDKLRKEESPDIINVKNAVIPPPPNVPEISQNQIPTIPVSKKE